MPTFVEPRLVVGGPTGEREHALRWSLSAGVSDRDRPPASGLERRSLSRRTSAATSEQEVTRPRAIKQNVLVISWTPVHKLTQAIDTHPVGASELALSRRTPPATSEQEVTRPRARKQNVLVISWTPVHKLTQAIDTHPVWRVRACSLPRNHLPRAITRSRDQELESKRSRDLLDSCSQARASNQHPSRLARPSLLLHVASSSRRRIRRATTMLGLKTTREGG